MHKQEQKGLHRRHREREGKEFLRMNKTEVSPTTALTSSQEYSVTHTHTHTHKHTHADAEPFFSFSAFTEDVGNC